MNRHLIGLLLIIVLSLLQPANSFGTSYVKTCSDVGSFGPTCKNGGKCTSMPSSSRRKLQWAGSYECECTSGWTGHTCEHATGTVSFEQNKVEKNVYGVGAWGGSCICPNGQRYQVGDMGNGCKSLACIGGKSGTCGKPDTNVGGAKVKVTCGQAIRKEVQKTNTCHMVAKAPKGAEDKCAPDNEAHEVRCCSDKALNGYQKKRCGSKFMWTESDAPGFGGCQHALDFGAANALCKKMGARLCTRVEINDWCTAGTGCGHDSDLVWSSTAPVEEPKCTGCSGRAGECWETCQQKTGLCSACDGTAGAKGACCMNGNPNDPAECSGATFRYSGYHECVLTKLDQAALNKAAADKVKADQAAATKAAAEKASAEKAASDKAASDKAEADRQEAEQGSFGSCHLIATAPKGSEKCAADSEKHEMRCCSSGSISGFKQKKCNGKDIWTESNSAGFGGCQHALTYPQALALCKGMGARLCSQQEINDRCAHGTGCGHDSDLIWSSDAPVGDSVAADKAAADMKAAADKAAYEKAAAEKAAQDKLAVEKAAKEKAAAEKAAAEKAAKDKAANDKTVETGGKKSWCDQDGFATVWEDEFNGNKLDESSWTIDLDGGDSKVRNSQGLKKNVWVANGNLVLKSDKERSGRYSYTSGAVDSRRKKSFGGKGKVTRACVSAKLPGTEETRNWCETTPPGQCRSFCPPRVWKKNKKDEIKCGGNPTAREINGARVGPNGNCNRCACNAENRTCPNPILPNSKGIWPAHWLMPDDISCWPSHGEIDILEAVNGDQMARGAYHWQQKGACRDTCGNGRYCPHPHTAGGVHVQTPVSEFHEYAVEYSKDGIRYAVDGVVYQEMTRRTRSLKNKPIVFYDVPYYMILNTAIGGPMPGEPTKYTKFPIYHTIDFVKFAQKK